MTSVSRDERAEPANQRDQFIPVRKADILDALVEHGAFGSEDERDQFRQICRLLAAIYHYEYFDQLERLRHAYFYFNPALDQPARIDDATLERNYADLVEALTAVLKGANFVEMSHAEVEEAHRTRKVMRVEVEAPVDDFREIRFFWRGHHTETVETSEWFGLRKRTHDVLVHDDLVLFVAMKPEAEIASKRELKLLRRRKIRTGSVLIKYFRHVANTDLHALFPNVRVVMSAFDKLALSLPALAGAIPILLNLASTVTVLFLVAGFYLGLVAAVEHDQMKSAVAAMSGLVALGGFVMRQWLRYQRQSLKYQKELTDNIYFRNVNNNAGIFDYIIGAAEEQECKEAFLAYFFLRAAKTALTQAELEERIERWLAATFTVEVEFEVADALAKLDRLGLLMRDGERLSVPPPKETLARLDRVWDGYFGFSEERVAAEG
jgi:hypothetical protein